MDEMRFDGRVAVVTGAGGGLGRAYAMLLAARGAKVIVNDLGTSKRGEGASLSMAQGVVNEIVVAGGEAVANGDTVATPEGGRAIIQAALDAFGRIDIVIHNATINRHNPFRDMPFEDFAAVIDVHLFGAFHLAKAAFPLMCDQKFGRIVLVSSICGLYGERNVAAYCAGKAALIGLSNALALEGHEHNVTSNCIVPAAETRLFEGRDTSSFPPMGPELVSPAVAWLAHESCRESAQLLVALAGRVGKAYFAETPGIYRPNWTVEDIVAEQTTIAAREGEQIFQAVPSGFYDHLGFSFGMGKHSEA